MAYNYSIALDLIFGTLGGSGTWYKPYPTIPTVTQWATAASLSSPNGPYTGAVQSLVHTASYFKGKITLSGGNAWDGVYDTINDIPITGLTPTIDAKISAIIVILSGQFGSGTIGGDDFGTDATITGVGEQYKTWPGASPPSLFTLSSGEMHISITDDATVGGSIIVSAFRLYGTYTILSFSWTLENPSVPITTGSLISITSPGGVGGLDLSHVTDPTISFVDDLGTPHTIAIPSIITQTSTLLQFYYFLWWTSTGLDTGTGNRIVTEVGIRPSTPVTVSVTGDGTQFSGSLVLGTLNVYIAQATGIYKIVSGKTADTLYTGDEDTTLDVKIPNPYAKTGFIGG